MDEFVGRMGQCYRRASGEVEFDRRSWRKRGGRRGIRRNPCAPACERLGCDGMRMTGIQPTTDKSEDVFRRRGRHGGSQANRSRGRACRAGVRVRRPLVSPTNRSLYQSMKSERGKTRMGPILSGPGPLTRERRPDWRRQRPRHRRPDRRMYLWNRLLHRDLRDARNLWLSYPGHQLNRLLPRHRGRLLNPYRSTGRHDLRQSPCAS